MNDLTPADADAIDLLNFIMRLALGICVLCVIGIARIEGWL